MIAGDKHAAAMHRALWLIADGCFEKRLGGGISEAGPIEKAKMIARAAVRADYDKLDKMERALRG